MQKRSPTWMQNKSSHVVDLQSSPSTHFTLHTHQHDICMHVAFVNKTATARKCDLRAKSRKKRSLTELRITQQTFKFATRSRKETHNGSRTGSLGRHPHHCRLLRLRARRGTLGELRGAFLDLNVSWSTTAKHEIGVPQQKCRTKQKTGHLNRHCCLFAVSVSPESWQRQRILSSWQRHHLVACKCLDCNFSDVQLDVNKEAPHHTGRPFAGSLTCPGCTPGWGLPVREQHWVGTFHRVGRDRSCVRDRHRAVRVVGTFLQQTEQNP